jgi:hypothetical protein
MYAMCASDKIMCVDHASTCVRFVMLKNVKHAHETRATPKVNLCNMLVQNNVSLVQIMMSQCTFVEYCSWGMLHGGLCLANASKMLVKQFELGFIYIV